MHALPLGFDRRFVASASAPILQLRLSIRARPRRPQYVQSVIDASSPVSINITSVLNRCTYVFSLLRYKTHDQGAQ